MRLVEKGLWQEDEAMAMDHGFQHALSRGVARLASTVGATGVLDGSGLTDASALGDGAAAQARRLGT